LKEEELQKTKEEVLDRMQKRKEKEEYEKAMKKHGEQVRKNFEEGVRGFY
jgi:thymidylate kinase